MSISRKPAEGLKVAGLFAGIGGIELGLGRAGHKTELLCEIDRGAQNILLSRFGDIPLEPDVTRLKALPRVDIVAGGFPCQNLSLAGSNTGIFGEQSGLVREVFRLLRGARKSPRWLILENVPFMLWQKKGEAIHHITRELSEMKYRWAYRVVDTRAFGLPQRRRRVIILASKTEDPREVLFADDAGMVSIADDGILPCGFSWTEGRAGLGWAVNAVPTLKGGSAIGIPSPPAIWLRDRSSIVTPNIRDAERLQGFAVDWTSVEVDGKSLREGFRWKLVGNALSVPVAEWLGTRLLHPIEFDRSKDTVEWSGGVWPNAAWGDGKGIRTVDVSEWPRRDPYVGLREFLQFPVKPLSIKATAGFLSRARSSSLNFVEGFLDDVERHLKRMTNDRNEDPVAA